MTGMIEGGWSFVWAAYGISFAVLGLYALTVISRYRRERLQADRNPGE